MLLNNLKNVEERILAACLRSGRERGDVKLIAVSKTKPDEMIQTFYDVGVRDFGENKVQELSAKMERLPVDICWHMIGHLQQNKVKYIAENVKLIHSVDSLKLAETIQKEALKHSRVIPVLIEVNVAGEESKFGVSPMEVIDLIYQISSLPNIHINGLMTVAPFTDNPENNRPVFQKMRQLSVDINSKNINNVDMSVLSMGMSNDFEIAIEEGSTMVRIGTDLFGERDYTI